MTSLNSESCVHAVNLFISAPHAVCHPVEEPANVDTGTQTLICDTSQQTERDEGFHTGKLSHAL